jgi:hypothetical protein
MDEPAPNVGAGSFSGLALGREGYVTITEIGVASPPGDVIM